MSEQTAPTTEVKTEQSTSSSETTTTATHTEQKPTSEATSTSPAATSPESSAPIGAGAKTEPEQKPADGEKKETAPAATEEEYEIELSKDSPLGQKDLEEIAQLAGELNLSKDQAQKLVASREAVFKAAKQSGEQVWETRFKQDLETLSKDPEFSGEARAVTNQHIKRALEAFGSKELIDYLGTMQGGSNLHLARFIASIGKALAPADVDVSLTSKGVAPEAAKESIEQRMYPSMFQK